MRRRRARSRRSSASQSAFTPRHSASLWTTYEFTDGFEAGLGVQYVGDRWSSNREERKALPIPPIAGALCVVAGAGLLMAGRRTA